MGKSFSECGSLGGRRRKANIERARRGAGAMVHCAEKGTKVDYLRGRTTDQVAKAAWEKTLTRIGSDPDKWSASVDSISVPGQAPIPYSNRGTYIQIVQMGPWGAFGRNIIPPGESE